MTREDSATLHPPAEAAMGESQWLLVWKQFRRRRLAVAATGIVLLLVTASIWAPFLANDRPIYYVGVNRFTLKEAQRTLTVVLNRLSREGRSETEQESPQVTIDRQFDLIASYLTPADIERLDKLRQQAVAAVPTEPGKPAAEVASKMRAVRLELRRSFNVDRLELVPRSHWPVIETLSGGDLLFMVFNLSLLFWPIWEWILRRSVGPQQSARRSMVRIGILVGLPLLSFMVWTLGVDERVDRTDYKLAAGIGADEGERQASAVLYQVAMWPPVPFGLDEDNLDQQFLEPVWEQDAATIAATLPSDDRPWSRPHVLGTDGIGRDILSRMLWGGRVSLAVGIVAVSIYVSIGVIVGSIAGYFRGITDLLISRIIEIVICFPSFFLILTIVAFVGPSIFNIMLVIGLTGWTGVARLVRGEFLRLGEQEFVLAGRALGYRAPRIIFRHVLPNALAPVLVSATFGIAGAILTESALSFLGFGIEVPKPSWGGILSSGRDALVTAPWLIYFPGMAIFLTITCYNLVGEALRDAADPRLRGSR